MLQVYNESLNNHLLSSLVVTFQDEKTSLDKLDPILNYNLKIKMNNTLIPMGPLNFDSLCEEIEHLAYNSPREPGVLTEYLVTSAE